MNWPSKISYPYVWKDNKMISFSNLLEKRENWRTAGKKIVTTNGCFDLLHTGHVNLLNNARLQGNILIVGINSDNSVRKIKGFMRPIMLENERANLLTALKAVDYVVIFDDLLPSKFLESIKPDIHCKAADYSLDSMPEAEVVKKYGGKVLILPLVNGISSTLLINRVLTDVQRYKTKKVSNNDGICDCEVFEYMLTAADVLRQTAFKLREKINISADKIANAFLEGNKVLLCGNGGSASDTQHMAAEFVGRFKLERNPLPAIALNADSSLLTALVNDFGSEQVYARQIEAFGKEGDILIAVSTSGSSSNIVEAVKVGKAKKMFVIGLSGEKPSYVCEKSDLCLAVPAIETDFIQQAHLAIFHLMCSMVENKISNG